MTDIPGNKDIRNPTWHQYFYKIWFGIEYVISLNIKYYLQKICFLIHYKVRILRKNSWHSMVTQSCFIFHHQDITWPVKMSEGLLKLLTFSSLLYLSKRAEGTVSRVSPPIRNIAGRPKLMENKGADKLCSLWSVWPGVTWHGSDTL